MQDLWVLPLQWKCVIQGSLWFLQITWMMICFSKSLTWAQLWGQMRSHIQIILRAGVIGRADKGNTLCHSAPWEHLGSVIACGDSWFNESIVSGRPGFTDTKRGRWTVHPHALFMWQCQWHFQCFFFFPLECHSAFFSPPALYSLQDLSSPTRDWTRATAVKERNPNHCTTRELPYSAIFFALKSFCILH